MHKLIFCCFLFLGQSCGKAPLLPDSYFDCERSFTWNTSGFNQVAKLHHSGHPKYVGKLAGIARSTDSRIQHRTESHGVGRFNQARDQVGICDDIYDKINGADANTFITYNLYQLFDSDVVSKVVKSNKEFQKIDSNIAIIENTAFNIDNSGSLGSEIIYNLYFETSVSCENHWLVKSDEQIESRYYFKEPEGKCYFSLRDYEMELPSGQKVLIALGGSYEKNPEHPQNMLIKIERVGFKKT